MHCLQANGYDLQVAELHMSNFFLNSPSDDSPPPLPPEVQTRGQRRPGLIYKWKQLKGKRMGRNVAQCLVPFPSLSAEDTQAGVRRALLQTPGAGAMGG